MGLLVTENLCKSYRIKRFPFAKTRQIDAVKNISFKLQAGKTLAIVGESGSGKSTLARQLIGIEKPTHGRIFFNDEELIYADKKQRKERYRNIRMIFQDPYESLNPQVRIGKTLDEVLVINTKLTASQRQQKVAETLLKVGLLPEHQYSYPHMFSGGQRQRVAIARAIILEPQIIIADEPLSALDVSIQAQILNLLQTLQEDMGISYIFISHDLNIVEHFADEVMVMIGGIAVEHGSIEQVFDNPLHPYTQALFASTPIYRQRFPDFISAPASKFKKLQAKGCSFAMRCHYCKSWCKQNQPKSIQRLNSHQVACFREQTNK